MPNTFDGVGGSRVVARRNVGVLALLYAVLLLPVALWRLFEIGDRIGGGNPPAALVLWLQLATWALLLVRPALYWCLWWLARRTNGSWALLAAAGVITFDALVVVLSLLIPTPAFDSVLAVTPWIGIASVLLFAAGLWLSGLVGRPVAWLAVAWAISALLLQGSFYLEPLASARSAIDALNRVLGLFVAAALGLALLLGDPSNKRIERTPRALS
jgi:hypothetical protein